MTAFVLHLVQFMSAFDHTGSVAGNANEQGSQQGERTTLLDVLLGSASDSKGGTGGGKSV
jgi:hypothetical protein